MNLWQKMSGIRNIARKVRFIYEPYKKTKIAYVAKIRNKYIRENGMKLVFEIDQALRDTSAEYFVDGGTLLGLIRNGKIIRWDTDIDFGICISPEFSWNDLEKVMKSAGFILHHQYRFKNEITEQTYQKRRYGYVDFFNHINDGNGSYLYSFYKKDGYNYKVDNQNHTAIFRTSRIEGTRQLDLNYGSVQVPVEAERYLEEMYGKNWRVPDPIWKPHSGPSCTELDDCELGVCEMCR